MFLPIATTLTKKHFFAIATTSLRNDYDKKKVFFILALFLLHSYLVDKILFFFCYYPHYAMITTKNKPVFIPTLISLNNYHEKNTAVLFPSGSSVFLENLCMTHQFDRQEFQWRVLVLFFLRKFSVFKRFVHDTLVSSLGTSVESYMLYYPGLLNFSEELFWKYKVNSNLNKSIFFNLSCY